MTATIDILIPTYRRPVASSHAHQFGSPDVPGLPSLDQTEDSDPVGLARFRLLRVLRAHGHTIDIHKHLPRRGIAEQRQFC